MVLLSAKNHIDRLFQRSLFINFTDYCVCCVSMSNVDNSTIQTIILRRDNRYLGRWIDGYLHQISSRVPEPEAGQARTWSEEYVTPPATSKWANNQISTSTARLVYIEINEHRNPDTSHRVLNCILYLREPFV